MQAQLNIKKASLAVWKRFMIIELNLFVKSEDINWYKINKQ